MEQEHWQGSATSIDRGLRRRGYRPGRPNDRADWLADVETVAMMRCFVCGGSDLVAHGYRNGKPLGYVCLATCPNCKSATEV